MPDEFFTEVEEIDHGPGVRKSSLIKIFRRANGGAEQIGQYKRTASFFYTFCPFRQNDKWFALYSSDIVTTRVMELPSCRDIAGEELQQWAFIPGDYYVPYEEGVVISSGRAGLFGFVAGFVQGDDSSWKIQYLDLSQIEAGKVSRKELFGYVQMPSNEVRLRDCISFSSYTLPDEEVVELTVKVRYDINTGKQVGLL